MGKTGWPLDGLVEFPQCLLGNCLVVVFGITSGVDCVVEFEVESEAEFNTCSASTKESRGFPTEAGNLVV